MWNRDQLLELWLLDKLTPEQYQEFERFISEDETWAKQIQFAKQLQHRVEQMPDLDVPAWERGDAFESDKEPWWRWQGLSVLSMAFSCCAIALVLFNVQVKIQNNGVNITFGHQGDSSTLVAKLVDERLKEFATEQQLVLANHMTTVAENQQEANLKLASYFLDTTRKERKQDLSDFALYVNDMRDEDKLDQKLMYQRLDYKLTNNNDLYQRANFEQPMNSIGQEK